MEDYQRENGREEVYSKRVKAGKRTYFIDVKPTKGQDYYLTITESKKRMDGGYLKHKIFLYKEDFTKFTEALNEAIGHIKTELMPGVDFDKYNRYDNDENSGSGGSDEMEEYEKEFDKF